MNLILNCFVLSVLFSIIVLSPIYIVNEKITFFRIFGLLTLFVAIVTGILFDRRILKTSRKLVVYSTILITFKFLVNTIFRFSNPFDAIALLLKELLTVSMLLIFESIPISGKKFENYIISISLIPVFFGLMQIFNNEFILSNILRLPVIEVAGQSSDYINNTNRIIGTDNIAIGFALLLGILFIFSFANWLQNKKNIVYGLLMFVYVILIIKTQTRSAIYGLLPSVFIAYLLTKRISTLRILFYSVIITMLLVSFTVIKSFIGTYSDRSSRLMDVNTYQKISSNVWGIYGALSMNPLIGVEKDKLEDAVAIGRKKLGMVVKPKWEYRYKKFDVAYHNLYALYLQEYGLIGFALFCVVIIKLFVKAFNKEYSTDRLKMIGVAIYFFQFAMFHNNKIFLYPLVWIILSIGNEKGES